MHGARTAPVFAVLLAACAGNPDRHTLAELRGKDPDMTEVRVEHGLDQAMVGYRKYLEEAPESSLTPEAMRRLADLKLEKEYGILGDTPIVELPAPETTADDAGEKAPRPGASGIADHSESEKDFERRAAGAAGTLPSAKGPQPPLPGPRKGPAGPLEAIALYDRILKTYPNHPNNDQVLYQKSRALDELGRNDEAIAVMERLIAEYPGSKHIDEVQFRRGEYFFTRRKYLEAEDAYSAITRMGAASEYYELAMYKLGWTFYKQELHEEALDAYMALLDHKVSIGYDFDQSQDEDSERRIADTFRVISLSFSNLGGQEVLADYFENTGHRSYEDRIYSNLGEFYLEKLRYADAAKAYQAFVALYPLHKASPHFSMRVVEIYEKGDFPKLVLEAKKEFAATYGLQSEYWRHFAIADSPNVVGYLKTNLKDLASYYHGLYQNPDLEDQKPESFQEAARWYRGYLTSFPQDPETPAIHHRLADLLLEHEDFGEAASEYERVAYEYPEHERAAAAGYAAIYALRQQQKHATGDEQTAARRAAVASTLRFVDRFPQHEQAAQVLGAAADDLYEMKEFAPAIGAAQRLIDGYPQAESSIRRDAWAVVAHSSIETGDYPKAELAYARVLEMTPEGDDTRQSVVDNLAAAIYKQGEQAKLAQDHRAAADHFLRIKQAAPSSKISPLAEYDAGAELIQLKDWAGATAVLDSFRQAHPDHELNREATKQLALVYREEGNAAAAAGEYQRVAAEADDPALRREALLQAGELYESAKATDRALAVYLEYVGRFPEPVETAVETRFKVAELCQGKQDKAGYRDQLRKIVEIDARAGDPRSPRVRYLAARSALVLTEDLYHAFDAVKLVQPFERSLKEKKRRMDAALDGYGRLVDYEVGEVTAGATFYMAEIYSDFSRALNESERPSNLAASERQEYETALEEEAFPFEEKAIEIHRKNLELLASGIYNPWIEKSLARLAQLMPGRYAKFEASTGLVTSIDRYAYRAPIPAVPAPAPAAETAPGEPAAAAAAVEPGIVQETDIGEAAPPPPAAPAEEASDAAR
ncbi:MAG TPA: tetratricopeptide repeat protein [Myxococcota bacterium]|jgi:TolA-binding protein